MDQKMEKSRVCGRMTCDPPVLYRSRSCRKKFRSCAQCSLISPTLPRRPASAHIADHEARGAAAQHQPPPVHTARRPSFGSKKTSEPPLPASSRALCAKAGPPSHGNPARPSPPSATPPPPPTSTIPATASMRTAGRWNCSGRCRMGRWGRRRSAGGTERAPLLLLR